MCRKLKVVVMTQNDRFFIPQNIFKVSKVCNIIEIVEVDCKSSLDNKLGDYYKWFGMIQFLKMGLKTIYREFQAILDRMVNYRCCNGFCSVKDIARKLNIKHRVIDNSNDKDFIQHIRDIRPDLIISYSAPQIIKEDLLSIPANGIINVHGSLLPDYRGCLPSFWYLYNQEKIGGTTVNYMSSKIDDGAILKQGSVDISDCKTMFQLMKKTKELVGELMVKAVEDITNNKVVSVPNNTQEGRCFTWPTVRQAREFRKNGYRLI